MTGSEPNTVFLPGVRQWLGQLGRLRDVVRQEVLRSQLHELTETCDRPLRVLDVGCGQGTQALHVARAGHRVTGLDVSAEMLTAFEQTLAGEPAEVRRRVDLVQGDAESAPDLVDGPYDLALCHGLLMYFDDPAPLLGALCTAAGPDAVLSLLVRNGLAVAMRDGLRGNWHEALAGFDRREYLNRLGIPAQAHTPADVDALLGPLGRQRRRWFGVRVFTDHRDEPTPPPEQLGPLLAAEVEAGRREPYRAVAALLHLVYGPAEQPARPIL